LLVPCDSSGAHIMDLS